jgi:hypothetical protein
MLPHHAVLTWNAPIKNTDNTPIPTNERLGYEICHSTSPLSSDNPTCDGTNGAPVDVGVLPTVDNGTGPQCTYTWTPIAAGATHYFRVRAYLVDTNGARVGGPSGFSNEASKTLP